MQIVSNALLYASIGIILLTLLLCSIKVFIHKNLFGKLIGLEVISNLVIVSIALLALWRQQVFYLNITLAIALIMFLGNVAYAKFMYARK